MRKAPGSRMFGETSETPLAPGTDTNTGETRASQQTPANFRITSLGRAASRVIASRGVDKKKTSKASRGESFG